jgi:hypothetical protein
MVQPDADAGSGARFDVALTHLSHLFLRERFRECGQWLYFARTAGQKSFPQHNPLTA